MVISKLEKEKQVKGILSETSEIPKQKLVTPIEVEKSDINESDISKNVVLPKKVETKKEEKKSKKEIKKEKLLKFKKKAILKRPNTKHPSYSLTRTFYIVQVMATKSLNEAKKYKNKLEKMGFNIYIRNPEFKGDYYRVQLGSFKNKKNAINLVKKLKKLGVKGFVRKQKVY